MLTQLDLENIGNLIDEKDEKLEQKLEEKFDKKFKNELTPIKKDIKSINSKLNKIQNDLTATIDFFDKDHSKLHKRVDRIEDHLHLLPLEL